MRTQNRERDLRHLFGATGRAHHAVYGGPNPGWPRWYAEHMYGEALEILDSDPSVDTVERWLIDADARFDAEDLEGSWPGWYSIWFLEWDDETAR